MSVPSDVALPQFLNLPCAHGGPAGTGAIRVEPEDFVVREWLGFDPDGEGDHWLLKVRKRGANTHWVVKQLSRLAQIHQRDIGFAGLKDRHAIAEQSFTVPVRSAIGSDWLAVTGDGFEVIEAVRHRRKLKRGALKGNDFEIVIREFAGDVAVLAARVAAVAADGVPNYFGPQRFGIAGGNLQRARDLFNATSDVYDRVQRGFALSAARSAIFNAVLASRVADRTWNSMRAGDVASLDGSNSIFPVDQVDALINDRCERQDVHPSGPLWGKGDLASRGDVAIEEQRISNTLAPFGDGLARAGLEQERRPLRLRVSDLHWTQSGEQIRLQFRLPRGAFATAVLHELISGVFSQVPEADEEQ